MPYLIRVGKRYSWWLGRVRNNVSTVLCPKNEKISRMGFWNYHESPYRSSTGHANYLRVIIIYCIPSVLIELLLFFFIKVTITLFHCSFIDLRLLSNAKEFYVVSKTFGKVLNNKQWLNILLMHLKLKRIRNEMENSDEKCVISYVRHLSNLRWTSWPTTKFKPWELSWYVR